MDTYTFTLTTDQMATLSGALDAAVKSLGLRAVSPAVVSLLAALEAAQASKPAVEVPKEGE